HALGKLGLPRLHDAAAGAFIRDRGIAGEAPRVRPHRLGAPSVGLVAGDHQMYLRPPLPELAQKPSQGRAGHGISPAPEDHYTAFVLKQLKELVRSEHLADLLFQSGEGREPGTVFWHHRPYGSQQGLATLGRPPDSQVDD